jgi:hypothetical protein
MRVDERDAVREWLIEDGFKCLRTLADHVWFVVVLPQTEELIRQRVPPLEISVFVEKGVARLYSDMGHDVNFELCDPECFPKVAAELRSYIGDC